MDVTSKIHSHTHGGVCGGPRCNLGPTVGCRTQDNVAAAFRARYGLFPSRNTESVFKAVSLVCKSGNNCVGAELLSIVIKHITGTVYVL